MAEAAAVDEGCDCDVLCGLGFFPEEDELDSLHLLDAPPPPQPDTEGGVPVTEDLCPEPPPPRLGLPPGEFGPVARSFRRVMGVRPAGLCDPGEDPVVATAAAAAAAARFWFMMSLGEDLGAPDREMGGRPEEGELRRPEGDTLFLS